MLISLTSTRFDCSIKKLAAVPIALLISSTHNHCRFPLFSRLPLLILMELCFSLIYRLFPKSVDFCFIAFYKRKNDTDRRTRSVPSMTGTHAPNQLPFVPRPLKEESFSSWLLRVAAENYVSIRELIQGFASVYPSIPLPCSLDRGLHLFRSSVRTAVEFVRAPRRPCDTAWRSTTQVMGREFPERGGAGVMNEHLPDGFLIGDEFTCHSPLFTARKISLQKFSRLGSTRQSLPSPRPVW